MRCEARRVSRTLGHSCLNWWNCLLCARCSTCITSCDPKDNVRVGTLCFLGPQSYVGQRWE